MVNWRYTTRLSSWRRTSKCVNPLIDGQGNFGSIDGDPAAASRYTEVRMSKIAGEMLADLRKETVDMMPNYDETLRMPVVLPTRIPNLLINGAQGIAVGMATNIPPHNIGEVVDACIALVDDESLNTKQLMEFVRGPDFSYCSDNQRNSRNL